MKYCVQYLNHNCSDSFDTRGDNILFVGDENIGDKGYQLLSQYFPNAKRLIWKKGADKKTFRCELRKKTWLLTVSFYNDYIFSDEDFDFIGLTLNIHPALPSIRGIGYDYIPLIEDHDEHGGTLHYINRPSEGQVNIENDIDSGRIIRIKKRKLSRYTTHGEIRVLNQQIAMEMLYDLCVQIQNYQCIQCIRHMFAQESNKCNLLWAKEYVTSENLHNILVEIKTTNPNHRVFMSD
jgi:hypothetical protein